MGRSPDRNCKAKARAIKNCTLGSKPGALVDRRESVIYSFPTMTKISTTEAARHLGDVLARVKHIGESFLLTKSNQPLARLVPVGPTRPATGEAIMMALERLPYDPEFAADLERVNRMDQVPENPWA